MSYFQIVFVTGSNPADEETMFPAYYSCTTHRMVCDAQNYYQNGGNIVVTLLSQKENETNISGRTHSTPHTNFDVM